MRQVRRSSGNRDSIGLVRRRYVGDPTLSIDTEVHAIRNWLLEGKKLKLSSAQLMAIDQLVSDRLRGFITMKDFILLLDISTKKFGAGLSFRASHQLGEKFELILNGGRVFDDISATKV